jgi:hypothetical protein
MDPDSDSDPANFFLAAYCHFLKVHLHQFFKKKSQKEVTTVVIKVFLTILA